MKQLWLIILFLFILTAAGCTNEKIEKEKTGEESTYMRVDAKQAKELMDTEEGYIILDVRTKEEFDTGHVPGAICIPNEEITDTQPELLPDKGQKILVYCRSGNRSRQASAKLSAMGYENIIEFGGISDWPYETKK